jgi:hypothetical protein
VCVIGESGACVKSVLEVVTCCVHAVNVSALLALCGVGIVILNRQLKLLAAGLPLRYLADHDRHLAG